MPEDYDDFIQVTELPGVRPVDKWSSPFTPTRHRKRKHSGNRKKSFKDVFLDEFNLDRGKFDVNLVVRDGEWYLEIASKRTGSRYYQRCDVLCDIIGVKVDDLKRTGVNVDVRI